MKKEIMDLRLASRERVGARCVLLRLTRAEALPEMRAGQFVEVRVDGAADTFLRRPISVHYVDPERNELWLLVQEVGGGTRRLGALAVGSVVNVVGPLGNGFTLPDDASQRLLLVGGGVGVAPLLYMGSEMRRRGLEPTFLLGARSAGDLLQVAAFERLGRVFVTTEDGSRGEKGFVTQHSLWRDERFDAVATCGPQPMMKAVARLTREMGIPCEASLENMMACGLGACLCCVENTKEGHKCVCKDGPVFNTDDLLWQI